MHHKLVEIITADGSPTLLNQETGEHYHSIHGAKQESDHVFLQHGLRYWLAQNPLSQACNIVEVGVGTGLNLWLTLQNALQQPKIQFHYLGFEPFPLAEPFLVLKAPLQPTEQTLLEALLSFSNSKKNTYISIRNFELTLTPNPFSAINQENKVDVMYYDAFSPNTAPEMWNDEHLLAIIHCLKSGGIMSTYCIRGFVKRFFKIHGLQVEKLPGAPGKREMMRIKKNLHV